MPGLLYTNPMRGLLSESEEPQGLMGALYQNPLMARQVASQRANRQVPESVTDPRWAEHQARQRQADYFLTGMDALTAAAPFAKPLGLLAGRMAGPAVESYMARTGLLQRAAPEDWLAGLFGGAVAPAAPKAVRISDDLVSTLRKQAEAFKAQAEDWASRKYKGNYKGIEFAGDGPTKNETMSVGAINESRRGKTVSGLVAQADALESAAAMAKSDPEGFTRGVSEALGKSQWYLDNRIAKNADDAADMAVGHFFLGEKNPSFGPNSAARAIREALGR